MQQQESEPHLFAQALARRSPHHRLLLLLCADFCLDDLCQRQAALDFPLKVARRQVSLAKAGGSKSAALQGMGVLPLGRQLEFVFLKLPHLQPHKYEVTKTRHTRKLSEEALLGGISSISLGLGTLFLLLWTGVYI
eukprot:jgi/Astpho2/232/Aster-x0906